MTYNNGATDDCAGTLGKRRRCASTGGGGGVKVGFLKKKKTRRENNYMFETRFERNKNTYKYGFIFEKTIGDKAKTSTYLPIRS